MESNKNDAGVLAHSEKVMIKSFLIPAWKPTWNKQRQQKKKVNSPHDNDTI